MNAPVPSERKPFDVERAREDFPQLARQVHGKPLVYLDNAATTQKPQQVLDAIVRYYTDECSNVHRGLHALSAAATADYEQAREKVRDFVGAADTREIVYTGGTTAAINLVAATWGVRHVGAGDEIVVSAMEHHSNIVPWQLLAERTGARLRVIPVLDSGELDLDAYAKLLDGRAKIVALAHVSNVLGTINPVKAMIEQAHRRGVPVLLDGAQALAHMDVDVRDLDVDFYAFSAHKMFGPTGIGALYAKRELLEAMPPYQGGGDMIRTVSFEQTTYNDLPFKFEAGTPNIAGAIGFGATVDYLRQVGLERIEAYENELLDHATDALQRVDGLRLIGTARRKSAVLSFTLAGIHPHDVATILDHEGVAIRAGHHCCQPLMERFGIPATARASLALYNTRAEVDALVRGLGRVREVLG